MRSKHMAAKAMAVTQAQITDLSNRINALTTRETNAEARITALEKKVAMWQQPTGIGQDPSVPSLTITDIQFGMNFADPTTTVPVWMPPVQRYIANWSNVETARGVYDWAAFDAGLAHAVANNIDIIFVFLFTPSWANGGAGVNVPATLDQDFFDFVTAVVTRAAGHIKYWEVWNEVNDSPDFWSGTQAHMITYAQNVRAIVKADNPSHIVGTPSVATGGPGGAVYLLSYLLAGGAAYADAVIAHIYNLDAPGSPPEQTWQAIKYFQAAMQAGGVGNLPLIIDEGGWLDSTQTPSTTMQKAWAAIWPLLMCSEGVAIHQWYAYDSVTFGTLWDGGTGLDAQGVAYQKMRDWLIGATFTSKVLRQIGTNGIRNTTGSGAVPGTPGTLPTNWAIFAPDSGHGIATQVVGTGIENGIPYVDWRVSGTATAGAVGLTGIFFETSQQIVSAVGQRWTEAVYVKQQAGSQTGCILFNTWVENNSGGASLGQTMNWQIFPNGAPLQYCIQQWDATTNKVGGVFVQPGIAIQYAVGGAFDITLRLAPVAMDRGTIWSGTISRPGGYQGQIIWDSGGGPTSYTAPNVYTSQTNSAGTKTAIVSHTVSLTGQPILLDNT